MQVGARLQGVCRTPVFPRSIFCPKESLAVRVAALVIGVEVDRTSVALRARAFVVAAPQGQVFCSRCCAAVVDEGEGGGGVSGQCWTGCSTRRAIARTQATQASLTGHSCFGSDDDDVAGVICHSSEHPVAAAALCCLVATRTATGAGGEANENAIVYSHR